MQVEGQATVEGRCPEDQKKGRPKEVLVLVRLWPSRWVENAEGGEFFSTFHFFCEVVEKKQSRS